MLERGVNHRSHGPVVVTLVDDHNQGEDHAGDPPEPMAQLPELLLQRRGVGVSELHDHLRSPQALTAGAS